MRDEPLVSVIMNGHNAGKYLGEAIDSVLEQTYSNWEIILWDNLSTDGTRRIVESYSDNRIRYFFADEFTPLGKARNLAIQKAKGEFLAFLDCDDIWLPEKLERQLPLFSDLEVGLVYSDTIFFNSAGQEKRLYFRRKPYRGWCFTDLLNNYVLSLETVVIRRNVLDKLDHWFDERFSAIEEVDLFVRIGLTWKVDFIPEPLAKWRVHGESWTWNNPKSFFDEKKQMLEKLEGDEEIALHHPGIIEEAKALLCVAEAKHYWANGSGRKARKMIGCVQKKSAKAILIWFMSFLPYRIIAGTRDLFVGTVTPK